MNEALKPESTTKPATIRGRTRPVREVGLIVALAAIVLLLGWLSFKLAVTRIYHADEFSQVFGAKILATAGNRSAAGSVNLFQVILSWFLRGQVQSVDLISTGRLMMVLVFWLNWILIAAATGQKLLSRGWFLALLGVVTLAPLWDFGFEVRPDNIVLTGILVIWSVVRFQPLQLSSFVFLGAMTSALGFFRLNSLIYTLPISCAVLRFPPRATKLSRGNSFIAWGIGALIVVVTILCLFSRMGIWNPYFSGLRLPSFDEGNRHKLLSRFLIQTPFLSALAVSGLVVSWWKFRAQGKRALSWDGHLPETMLFLVSIVVLLVRPSIRACDLLLLAPFAFLCTFRYGQTVLKEILKARALYMVFGMVLVFGHFVPFWFAVRKHFWWTNMHQELVMERAERMTQPGKDFVYDGVGMVMSRARLENARVGSSRMFASTPPAVFIPNYVTDKLLNREDQTFVQSHYVPLSDDFWVLGKVLPYGGGEVEIIHPGRYRISTLKGSDLDGTYAGGLKGAFVPEDPGVVTGSIDGKPITSKPMELEVGIHRLSTSADCQPTVVWMGPQVDRIHRCGQNDHQFLLLSGY